jgi:hypothetical protein
MLVVRRAKLGGKKQKIGAEKPKRLRKKSS